MFVLRDSLRALPINLLASDKESPLDTGSKRRIDKAHETAYSSFVWALLTEIRHRGLLVDVCWSCCSMSSSQRPLRETYSKLSIASTSIGIQDESRPRQIALSR